MLNWKYINIFHPTIFLKKKDLYENHEDEKPHLIFQNSLKNMVNMNVNGVLIIYEN